MTVIKKKRDPSALWTANNPILADGEHGWETDTDRFKIGDGATHWNDDPDYYTSELKLRMADNRWKGHQDFDSMALRDGNFIDVLHQDFHPSSQSRSTFFDGNSHPIGTFFSGATPAARLANAQAALGTFITDENVEADWVTLQKAILSTVNFPRGWVTGSDWRQRGTARILLPVDADLMINKPLTKAANANKNYRIGSETSQGARINYIGGDGGRIFDFEKDSVGSVLCIENMVLNGGGIRLKGPYRGDIRLGNGILATDTPHPAIHFIDESNPANQVGVVGPIIESFYTENCAGGVWAESSTATITTVRDCRFMSNTDIGLKINGTTDVLVENIDFTGMKYDKAITGNYPYVQISATLDTCSNIDIRDVRCGSEVIPVGGTPTVSEPPMDYFVLGGVGTEPQNSLGYVKFRKVAFRTPPTAQVSPTLARVAINLKAKCSLDIDDCDFGEFKDCLVDETWARVPDGLAPVNVNRWGEKNFIDAGHNGPIFSNGGVNWITPSRLPTQVDRRVGADPGDGENLATTTDFSSASWLKAAITVGPATAGGPNGSQYHSFTRTTTGSCIIRRQIPLTAGKKYCFGIFARKGTIRNIRMYCAQVGGPATVLVDQRDVRLDSDWNMYWWRIPYVSFSGDHTFTFYIDDDHETDVGGTMDACLPFINEGWVPKPPRTGLRLTSFRAAPATPVVGTHYLADGVLWDPKGRGLSRPYEVMWDGTSYEPVTAPEPSAAVASSVFSSTNAATTTTDANTSTDKTLVTHANIPAASLHVGDRIKIRAQGNIDTKASPGTFNLRSRVNGTTVFTSSLVTSSATSAATGAPWQLDWDVLVTATGSGGSLRIVGQQITASGATNVRTQTNVMADIAVDLSGGFLYTITGNTATADALNIIRHHASMVEKAA